MTDARLRSLAQVAGRVVSAILTRLHLRHLAEEQAALRRIAELIATGAAPSNVFPSIAAELSRLLDDSPVVIVRFDAEGPVIAAACRSGIAVGTRLPVVEESSVERSPGRSGHAEEMNSITRSVFGGDAESGVGVPVTVADQLSGALLIAPRPDTKADPAETHLDAFADLAAATIANARTTEALIASRERMVRAANDARHQLQRDVHDGAQQRLVHTILALKLARDQGAHGISTAALIQEALTHAEEANRQLRDLVRGILPVASLGEARCRHRVLRRRPAGARHAAPAAAQTSRGCRDDRVLHRRGGDHERHQACTRRACRCRSVALGGRGHLHLRVRDDGVGGADPAMGTGLTGLTDRIEAAGGTITITSPTQALARTSR
jgi:signal transduction histidine kinase